MNSKEQLLPVQSVAFIHDLVGKVQGEWEREYLMSVVGGRDS
jgi:hypothetical protein